MFSICDIIALSDQTGTGAFCFCLPMNLQPKVVGKMPLLCGAFSAPLFDLTLGSVAQKGHFVMIDTEKAYLAGYFDADGCVYGGFSGSEHVNVFVGIRLAGRDLALLQELQFVYGGTISQSSNPNNCISWAWAQAGRTALQFLTDMLPYLRYKKGQAEYALKIINTLGGYNRWNSISPDLQAQRAEWALGICELNQANMSKPKVTKTIVRLQEIVNTKRRKENGSQGS